MMRTAVEEQGEINQKGFEVFLQHCDSMLDSESEGEDRYHAAIEF